jgi:uncharacterized protein YbjT (DUF2867 family)
MGGMVAVVAGSTGMVGQELVRQLCSNKDYSAVIALVRDPAAARALLQSSNKVLIRELPTGQDTIVGDEFYCALGTTIKKAGSKAAFAAVDHDLVLDLAARARAGGVGRVVVVTSVGSDSNSSNFYLRVKGQTERDLVALGLKRLEIYRPSLLLGSRSESRPMERFGIIVAPFLSWTLRGALSKYRPISAVELAAKMIRGEPLAGS